MKLSSEQIKELSARLDEVMSLPKSHWRTWIESNATSEVDPVHRKLRALASSGFLEKTEPENSQGEDEATMSAQGVREWFPALPNIEPIAAKAVGDRIGPYRLLELIARGGMGNVWLAERADGAYQRRVALKLPYAGAYAKVLAKRFETERDLLAMLEHPNIARFYDAGIDGATPFIALELVQGEPVTDYCKARSLSVAGRLALFDQVLRAVQHAHANLIIHRDLKPNNVLVTETGEVKLLDFGISKLLSTSSGFEQKNNVDELEIMAAKPLLNRGYAHEANTHDLTRVYGQAMTPRCASPEQLFGQPVTTASDVYSLGVLLYQMLAERAPFADVKNDAHAMREALNQGTTPLLRAAQSDASSNDAIDRDIECIVQKAMQRAPEDRYATASEFADDLARFRAKLPVRARTPTPAYATKKFLQRNWLSCSAIAAGFVGVSAFATFAYFEGQTQRRTKEFLLETLTPSTYYTDGGGVLTQAEMLNRAAASAEKRLSDQPRAMSEIYQAIGESLFNLGEHEDAFRVRSKAQPLIDQVYGRESREAVRNASRAAYMHLTQRRFTEFQAALEDLKTRCPSLQAVPQDQCYGVIWIQTQYYAYTGEGNTRAALWDDYDRRVLPTVDEKSRWHEISNYWGAGAARQSGDLVKAKARWAKLLALPKQQASAKGSHMEALSIAAMLNESGFHKEAAALARDAYVQGERWMGEAFDKRLFYVPGVAIAEAAAGVDYGSEAKLRRSIAMSLERTGAAAAQGSASTSGTQEVADAYAALALLLMSKHRFAEARTPLEEAIRLQRERPAVYNQFVTQLEVQLAVLALLEKTPASNDLRHATVAKLQALRELAAKHNDRSSLPRIDAMLALTESDLQRANEHWTRAERAMLDSHARPADIAVLLRAAKSERALPPPVSDATIVAMREFAQKVLVTTGDAMAARRTTAHSTR